MRLLWDKSTSAVPEMGIVLSHHGGKHKDAARVGRPSTCGINENGHAAIW
jgi:hypothetical protein